MSVPFTKVLKKGKLKEMYSVVFMASVDITYRRIAKKINSFDRDPCDGNSRMKLKLLTLSMLIREVVDHHHIYRCIKHMYRYPAVGSVLVIYIKLDTKVVLTKLYFSHMGAFFQRMTN